MNNDLIDLSDPPTNNVTPSAPPAPVSNNLIELDNSLTRPNDLLFMNIFKKEEPKMIELKIIFQSNWHPTIPFGYTLTFNFYTNSNWRYIRNIYANTMLTPECSLFLSKNGIAFDADMSLEEYSINSNIEIDSYLVPGIKFK